MKHKRNYKTNLGKHIFKKQDKENKIKTRKEKGIKNEYLKAKKKKLLGLIFDRSSQSNLSQSINT